MDTFQVNCMQKELKTGRRTNSEMGSRTKSEMGSRSKSELTRRTNTAFPSTSCELLMS